MKKLNYLLIALIAAASPMFVGCSDDDDAPQLPTIQQGEIPAKNLYVTIDGTFIYNREGTAQISGTVDPNATEQHLQMTCDPMFITYLNGNNIVKESPVFDIIVSNNNGKSTVTGKYEGNNYVINLDGEVSVNYNGESDWRLVFTQEKTAVSVSNAGNKLSGKTFEFEISDEYITCNPIFSQGDSYMSSHKEKIKDLFKIIVFAYKENSGYDAARISFVDDYNCEISFRDASGKYVMDGFKHKYINTSGRILVLDEIGFNKEQSEFYDLSNYGIGFKTDETLFSTQSLIIDPNSLTEFSVTCFKYQLSNNGVLSLIFDTEHNQFLSRWKRTDKPGRPEYESPFTSYQFEDGNLRLSVNPTIVANLVK